MKKLLIAEKPSAAIAYQEMIEVAEGENFTKMDGYLKSQNHTITWCYGHLVQPASPEAYGWTEWNLDQLPMIPKKWVYNKTETGKKQFAVIQKLINDHDVVINGADAGREGELIYRLVMHLTNSTNKTQLRLWTNSFVLTDLLTSWKTMKPLSEYDNLYKAALMRQKADWLVGMNLSRLYSLTTQNKLSVGRVQTPTLNLIVSRENEIKNWTKKEFFELHVLWNGFDFVYTDGHETKFENNNELKTIQSLTGLTNGVLTELIKSKKGTNPNNPFSLNSLQIYINSKYGFTADKSLNVLQGLYEKKLCSYPRTDSEYLPETMIDTAYEILEKISSLIKFDKNYILAKNSPNKIFNSKKVTDHYAIIPTGIIPNNLNKDEEIIYNSICERFIESMGKPYLYLSNSAKINSGKYNFISTINVMIDPGFKALYSAVEKPKAFNYNQGNSAIITSTEIQQKEVPPPALFTEGTLLKAMETAGKKLNDLEAKEAMKNHGLGTPATRASIIETLKTRKYIELKKKSLVSTEKGRALISIMDPKIKSVELTGEFEKEINLIATGEQKNWQEFIQKIEQMLIEICSPQNTKQIETQSKTLTFDKHLKCPKCKQDLNETAKGLFCQSDKNICGFVLWPTAYEKKLTKTEIADLLTKRKTTHKVQGLKFKDKAFEAVLVLNDDFKVTTEKQTPFKSVVPCPKCNNEVKSNTYYIQCDKCDFKINRINFGYSFTEQEINKLLSGLEIGPIKNLKGKNKTFSASFKIKEDYTLSLSFNK
jgi:DNA topoisomerase-3